MDTAEHYSTRNLIADIWLYIKPYKRIFWIATIIEIIAAIAWLYPPYALAIIINFFTGYIPGADLMPIYAAFVLTIGALVIAYGGFYIARVMIGNLGEKALLDAQHTAMRHIMLLDINWHEKETAGGKFKRIDRGSMGIHRLLRLWIEDILETAINLFGVTFIIFHFDRVIGAALIVFLITYYYIAYFFRKRALLAITEINKKEERRSGILFEAITNIRSVKVMSMSETTIKNLIRDAADLLISIKERIYWLRTGTSLSSFYAQMFRVGIMIFIIYGIIEGYYAVGFLILFYSYFNNIWQAISKAKNMTEDFSIAKNAIGRMQDMLAVPVTIDDETGKVPFPADWQEITLKNVSFSYNNKPVLRNISFTVKRGEKIGVVGLSGAGKSTLFKLLLKEHESYKGRVAFDGVPLTSISKKDYFNYVAVVLQETELFNASLKDNVTITNQKQEKNKALFEKALVTSHVKDFMPKLPKGTNTIIGEKGVKLSGGEKQRVGIARAIFKDPQVFLLDEATSHLDIESEEKIQDSLHAFFGGVTAIVIAHRLTTIKEMDRILVIEDGRILESGTFAELHALQGRFFELWEKQKL